MAVIFHPPFPDFFFTRTGFFGRHLRHLFVITFLKSTFTTMFTITGMTSIVLPFVVSFKELLPKGLPKNRKGLMTKGNLFMSLKGNFRCQFVCSLHGVLAKIILRSCVTRNRAICIKNSIFEYFDGTNPITGKGVTMLKVSMTCRYMYQSALKMDQHEPNTKEVLVKAFENPQSHP